MSGPAAAIFEINPLLLPIAGAVVFSALALRQFGQEYQAALDAARAREAEVRAARELARKTRIQHFTQLKTQAEEKKLQLVQLQSLAEGWQSQAGHSNLAISGSIAEPAGEDEQAWARYSQQIAQAIEQVRNRLAQAAREAGEKTMAATRAVLTEGVTSLDDMLNAYAAVRALQSGLTEEEVAVFRATADRILKRLDLTDSNGVLPAEFEMLARDIVLAPTVDRAEALATELRYQVQKYRQEEARRHEDALQAANYLQALPDDAPAYLADALTSVAAGGERLLPEIREAVEALLEATKQAEESRNKEAAAIVLEHSLKDLGYEVESVDNTLFVDGGLVHFQKPGWENYFVRMRVNAEDKSMAFNVVRAETGDQSVEQKRLDTLAEDRWCTEFPHLLKTLEARGLAINVTRLLGAGELPVQVVPASSLPQQESESSERKRREEAPQLRELP